MSYALASIQPFMMCHAGTLAAAVRETAVGSGKCLIWMTNDYSVSDAEAFVRGAGQAAYDDKAYNFGLFTETGECIGGVSIHTIRRDLNCGDVGYWIRESAQRQGLGGRAGQWIKRFAFTKLKLERLNICTSTSNIASQRIAQDMGGEFMWSKPRQFPPEDGLLFTIFKENGR